MGTAQSAHQTPAVQSLMCLKHPKGSKETVESRESLTCGQPGFNMQYHIQSPEQSKICPKHNQCGSTPAQNKN